MELDYVSTRYVVMIDDRVVADFEYSTPGYTRARDYAKNHHGTVMLEHLAYDENDHKHLVYESRIPVEFATTRENIQALREFVWQRMHDGYSEKYYDWVNIYEALCIFVVDA